MVDRNAGVGCDGGGVAVTCLAARRVWVDQSDAMPGALQIQCTATADHSGTDNQLLRGVHLWALRCEKRADGRLSKFIV